MPFYMYYDPTYILVLIGVVLSLLASAKVKTTFAKYSNYRNSNGMTGAQAAQRIHQLLRAALGTQGSCQRRCGRQARPAGQSIFHQLDPAVQNRNQLIPLPLLHGCKGLGQQQIIPSCIGLNKIFCLGYRSVTVQ